MPEIIWEDPPGAYSRGNKYRELLDQIRQQPGRWARLDGGGKSKTSTVAANIKRGVTAGSAPAGSFEAVSRTVDGKSSVYVRYVGDFGDEVADAVSETAAARADATEWGDTK